MNMMKKAQLPVLLAGLIGAAGMVPAVATAGLSGNIGVHSMYLLRGIGKENDSTAVQGGLDYAHDSGFYAGWWASNLGYTYDKSIVDDPATPVVETQVNDGHGFENDFYIGYAGEVGAIGFDIGLIQYYYIDVDDSDLTEAAASVSFGDFSAGFQYLLNDGWWGNSGDIYWKAGYGTSLPKGFGLDLTLGYYTYNDDDTAKIGGPGTTTNDGGFRHLDIALSHPVGNTGADMYIQYTVAGEDRGGNSYDNQVVLGLTYGFDI